jgi:hypothetical protein
MDQEVETKISGQREGANSLTGIIQWACAWWSKNAAIGNEIDTRRKESPRGVRYQEKSKNLQIDIRRVYNEARRFI